MKYIISGTISSNKMNFDDLEELKVYVITNSEGDIFIEDYAFIIPLYYKEGYLLIDQYGNAEEKNFYEIPDVFQNGEYYHLLNSSVELMLKDFKSTGRDSSRMFFDLKFNNSNIMREFIERNRSDLFSRQIQYLWIDNKLKVILLGVKLKDIELLLTLMDGKGSISPNYLLSITTDLLALTIINKKEENKHE